MQVSYLISREVFPVMPAQAGIQDIPVEPINTFLDSPSTSLRTMSPSTLLRTVSLSNGLSNGRLRGNDKGGLKKLPASGVTYNTRRGYNETRFRYYRGRD